MWAISFSPSLSALVSGTGLSLPPRALSINRPFSLASQASYNLSSQASEHVRHSGLMSEVIISISASMHEEATNLPLGPATHSQQALGKAWQCLIRVSLRKTKSRGKGCAESKGRNTQFRATWAAPSVAMLPATEKKAPTEGGWGFRDTVIVQISLLGLSLCAMGRCVISL